MPGQFDGAFVTRSMIVVEEIEAEFAQLAQLRAPICLAVQLHHMGSVFLIGIHPFPAVGYFVRHIGTSRLSPCVALMYHDAHIRCVPVSKFQGDRLEECQCGIVGTDKKSWRH